MRHYSRPTEHTNKNVGAASDSSSSVVARETDRLLPSSPNFVTEINSNAGSGIDRTGAASHHRGSITRRHAASSRSPPLQKQQQHHQISPMRGDSQNWQGRSQPQQQQIAHPQQQLIAQPQQQLIAQQQSQSIPSLPAGKTLTDSSYDVNTEASRTSRSHRSSRSSRSGSYSSPSSARRQQQRNYLYQQQISDRQQYYNNRANRMIQGADGSDPPLSFPQPLLEVPEEIYAVRRAALMVLEPLTYAWLVFAVGFALTLALGMSRWMYVLPSVPYWFIMLPAWLSHLGMLICLALSGRALSRFITDANENRQRQDTTDHLDRTEYLPLLQRSLKFGLKTGTISFCVFVFEILLYVRVSRNSISLATVFIPLWIIVCGGIIDGIVCKTQHMLRLLCWMLMFTSMLLAVIKVDHSVEVIRWRAVISPIVALLSIAGASLIYIVYGHQVGYFRLTESQLTAGILYSMAALICIVLLVVLGEVIPVVHPIEFETRLFMITLAPLIMSLVGVGAWAVSRDEFERLLQFGGQSLVHPMKLRMEQNGWTSVESQGVAVIPMFGEVSYEPLDSTKSESIEMCSCCACYPYEDEEDIIQHDGHPHFNYLSSNYSRSGNGSRVTSGAIGVGV